MRDGPALGLLELCSIARGVVCCDAMLKRASVHLVRAGSVHPGKYSIVLRGGVEEVEESMAAGVAVGGDTIVDTLFLPFPHQALVRVLDAPMAPPLEALGILETYAIAATIRGADAALKAAEIMPIRIRLADDLGGKGFFVFTGLLHDVQEAVAAGRAAVGEGLVAGCEIVANPHPEIVGALT